MHPFSNHAPSGRAAVPYDAPAVERGMGFFETVLLIGRRAVLWERHLLRLLSSLAHHELPAPSNAMIAQAAAQAIADIPADSSQESALRLAWIAIAPRLDDPDSWRLDASVRPISEATRRRRDGAQAITLPASLVRDTPELKSTSYIAAVLGLRFAERRGGNEGLFSALDGSYREGTSTALLAWDEGRLLQSKDAVLPSVTAAAFTGRDVPRGILTRSVLCAGAILLGSLTKAVPLLSLDGQRCLVPPPMQKRIDEFNRQMEQEASLFCEPSIGCP